MRRKSGDFDRVKDIKNAFALERNKKWFVVASSTEAVIYQEKQGRLTFVDRLSNPSARLPERMLDSDRPGRGTALNNPQHQLDRHFNHHEQAARGFAHRIGEFLESAREDVHFNELVLVTEPRFLGLLRAALSPGVRNMVKEEVRRQFRQGSDKEFREWYTERDEIKSVPLTNLL
jgi:protein required for attachment to host cells